MAAGELNNLVLVWTTVLASLWYCYIISKIFTKSTISRFLYFLPVNLLFLVLPLNLSSIFLGGTTCFLIAWLANFKLVLFAFNNGPLFSKNSKILPLSQFIVVACFPIKVREPVEQTASVRRVPIFSLKYFIRTMITRIPVLAILIYTLPYREHIHPLIMLTFHGFRVALGLEMLLTLFAALARGLLLPPGVELERPFRNFFLATSVQNYWGKRWNRVVSDIFRLIVYNPVRSLSARFITRKWASVPAVLVTFLASGLMHELVLYNISRVKSSGRMLCFFLLHGSIVSVEIVLKKKFAGKLDMPRVVSWLLTMAFVSISCSWLFLPPISAAMADLRTCTEAMAFFKFVFTLQLVPPADLHCPFL